MRDYDGDGDGAGGSSAVSCGRAGEAGSNRRTVPVRTTSTRVAHLVAFAPDNVTVVAWDSAGFAKWNPETGKTVDRQPVIAKAAPAAAGWATAIGGWTHRRRELRRKAVLLRYRDR